MKKNENKLKGLSEGLDFFKKLNEVCKDDNYIITSKTASDLEELNLGRFDEFLNKDVSILKDILNEKFPIDWDNIYISDLYSKSFIKYAQESLRLKDSYWTSYDNDDCIELSISEDGFCMDVESDRYCSSKIYIENIEFLEHIITFKFSKMLKFFAEREEIASLIDKKFKADDKKYFDETFLNLILENKNVAKYYEVLIELYKNFKMKKEMLNEDFLMELQIGLDEQIPINYMFLGSCSPDAIKENRVIYKKCLIEKNLLSLNKNNK